MGPDQTKDNIAIIVKMKRKAIVHGHGAFPYLICSLDFLDPQTWMAQIFHKNCELFIESILNIFWEPGILLFERSAKTNCIHFLSHSRLSWTE